MASWLSHQSLSCCRPPLPPMTPLVKQLHLKQLRSDRLQLLLKPEFQSAGHSDNANTTERTIGQLVSIKTWLGTAQSLTTSSLLLPMTLSSQTVMKKPGFCQVPALELARAGGKSGMCCAHSLYNLGRCDCLKSWWNIAPCHGARRWLDLAVLSSASPPACKQLSRSNVPAELPGQLVFALEGKC